MNSMAQSQRYLPHTLNTKYISVNHYKNDHSTKFIHQRYKISKSFLILQNRKFEISDE